jgi:hypothetical protein
MSGEARMGLYNLASRISDGVRSRKAIDISPEEIATLKTRILKCWSTFTVGAAYRLLDEDMVVEDLPAHMLDK